MDRARGSAPRPGSHAAGAFRAAAAAAAHERVAVEPEGNPELDPVGSLIDADMGAYYHWINQQRLPGSERSAFLVWFEGHSQAVAIAPSFPKGTESGTEMDLGQLLSLAAT